MKIEGELKDGRRVIRTHMGVVIETVEQMKERLAAEKQTVTITDEQLAIAAASFVNSYVSRTNRGLEYIEAEKEELKRNFAYYVRRLLQNIQLASDSSNENQI